MPNAADLAKAGCKYLGQSYEKMDCQRFVEQCLRDNGIGDDLAGSNAWYRKMTWTGTPEECKAKFGEIPKGAFLFILEKDGKEPAKYRNDGIGNASHIGLKTGMTGKEMVRLAESEGNTTAGKYNFGDGAIHSSSSRGAVSTSNFKDKTIRGGWNRIGLWAKIDYGAAVNAKLRSTDEIPDDYQPTEPLMATIFASSGTTVKLRQRPSTGCSLYWNVPIGESVEVLKRGDWDRVIWNGKTGYIRHEFVHVGESMATIEPEATVNETPLLAIVWADEGNTVKMRYKPDSKCALYEKIPIGSQIVVNQKGQTWSKVSAGKYQGWYMMTKFLKFEEE